MKKHSTYFSMIALVMTLSVLACSLPVAATPTSQVIVVTATAQPETAKATAIITAQVEPALATGVPSAIPASPTLTSTNQPPTETPTATATATQTATTTTTLTPTTTELPCNRVSFVTDVSVPDGTVIKTGTPFTKTWRFRNTGSCTWTSGYQLVFIKGDAMNGAGSQSLTNGLVPPNSTVDVSINLVAPASAGTYKGFWKIREPGGEIFGLSTGSFWVEIKTEEPGPPTVVPGVKAPDLFVTEFTISPATPVNGQPAHVRIGVYNQGNAVASQFTVLWYGLSTFVNPGCSWTVDSMNANGGRILECDFVFQSPYPLNKTSLVIVDPNNQVAESNESNNQGYLTPFGVVNP